MNQSQQIMHDLGEGKGQDMVLAGIEKAKEQGKTEIQLGEIQSDRALRKQLGLGIVQFKDMMRAASALAKRGKIKFDGVSKITL